MVRRHLLRLAICGLQISWFCLTSVAQSGGGVVPRALVLERVPPEYTPEARAAGLEGLVVLYVEVTRDGQLQTAHVLQSLGMGLDEKAIDAVKHWRFAANSKGVLPPVLEQSVTIPFRLPEARSWQIRQSDYRARRSASEAEKIIVEPVLAQYVRPDAGSCTSPQARAVVDFEIKKDGRTQKVAVASTEGEGVGDAVAKAIAGWVFQPGSYNGSRMPATGYVEMECQAADQAARQDVNQQVGKVGAGVSAPTLISKREPEYSLEARQEKREGTVLMSIEIDETGHPVNMVVVRSLGMGLDEKAMQALNLWRFRPGLKGGKPVKVSAQVELSFRLR